jgi:hypothetical protein
MIRVKFISELFCRVVWHRYHCYSLFKADTINKILLWSLLPFTLLAYYYSDMQTDFNYQWYIYFVKKEFFTLFLAIIVYNHYKKSRDAGIATAVMIACIYNTFQEMLGLSNKYEYIDIIWITLMYVLILHSLYRYFIYAR